MSCFIQGSGLAVGVCPVREMIREHGTTKAATHKLFGDGHQNNWDHQLQWDFWHQAGTRDQLLQSVALATTIFKLKTCLPRAFHVECFFAFQATGTGRFTLRVSRRAFSVNLLFLRRCHLIRGASFTSSEISS